MAEIFIAEMIEYKRRKANKNIFKIYRGGKHFFYPSLFILEGVDFSLIL